MPKTREQPRVALRSDFVLLPLDEDWIGFSEQTQRLISLDAASAFVCRALQQNMPASQLPQALVAGGLAPPALAADWVTSMLQAFAAHDVLLGDATLRAAPNPPTQDEGRVRVVRKLPPIENFQPVSERRYRLLETCALIRYGHSAQQRLVDSVLGHLATDESDAPTTIITIFASSKLNEHGHLRSAVYRDGLPVQFAPRLSELGPEVKALLWHTAVNAYDFLFYLHAGVVGTAKGCILLPGSAGSGKSSLTTALVGQGFTYFSDEIGLVQRNTFLVPPIPLATCVKSTGWEVIAPYRPDIANLPTHVRQDEKIVRYLPPLPHTIQRAPAPVAAIVFPKFEAECTTEIRRLPRTEALGRLMGECLALSQHLDEPLVRRIVDWIASIDCHALTFSSLGEASAAVGEATRQLNRK